MPGINRALESRQKITVRGKDLYGVEKEIDVNVAGIGPLIVLKANAFGGPTGRRHPKDAFDLLLLVATYLHGSDQAIAAFREEALQSNSAYESAIRALERDFCSESEDGPMRAAEFLRGTWEESERIRQDLVTVAQRLLAINL